MRKKLLFKFLTILNKLLPKYDHVMLHGNKNLDDNILAIAKFVVENYRMKIYFGVSGEYEQYARKLLPAEINIIPTRSVAYFIKYLTSRYVFFTTGSFLNSFSKRQVAINIWHGILYKRVKKLRGFPGIPAHVTVATSPLTQVMFSEAFGVSLDDVIISGYPRNDVLLNAKNNKVTIKNRILEDDLNMKKIILWMPTFRQNSIKGLNQDGMFMNNPFNLDYFDEAQFNDLLKKYDVLCFIKPHPAAQKINNCKDLSNLKFIDDKWIAKKGISLYQLVACSDILISDISSIIADYLLLDNPILCVCSDMDSYKNTRGFYFENIEEWLPSKFINTQNELCSALEIVLKTGEDLYKEKRQKIKNLFYADQDTNSTKRLVDHVFISRIQKKIN